MVNNIKLAPEFAYNAGDNWFSRVWDQTRFTLAKEILAKDCEYKSTGIPGALEKIGDAGLWIVEEFPRKVWTVMNDPRVVTAAATAFAMLAVSFAFYPTATYLALKGVVALLPVISFETVRFTAWAVSMVVIASAGFGRGLGRWCNTELRNHYYDAPVQPVAQEGQARPAAQAPVDRKD